MSARLRALARQTEEIVAAGGYRASDGRAVSFAATVEAARTRTGDQATRGSFEQEFVSELRRPVTRPV